MAKTKAGAARPATARADADVRAARAARVRRAAELLRPAGEPTRLQILLLLAEGERRVGALRAELGLKQPPTSHHLALLRHCGLVAPRREGKSVVYSLTEAGEVLARLAAQLAG